MSSDHDLRADGSDSDEQTDAADADELTDEVDVTRAGGRAADFRIAADEVRILEGRESHA